MSRTSASLKVRPKSVRKITKITVLKSSASTTTRDIQPDIDPESDALLTKMVMEREATHLHRINAEIWLLLFRVAKENPASASMIFGYPRQRVDEIAAMQEAEVINLASSTTVQFSPTSIINNSVGNKKYKHHEVRHLLAAMQAMLNCHTVWAGR